MKLRALLLISGIVLIAKLFLHFSAPAIAAPAGLHADAATEAQILRATVQIALFEADAGRGFEVGGRGLGTLVRHNGETLIVTHDHWQPLNPNLHEVEFRTAYGALLLTLNAERFRSLIRYRDGGTLILVAPAEIVAVSASTLVPAGTGEANAAASGDTVWLAQRRAADGGNTVEVVAAQVEALEASGGLPRLRLRGADGTVVVPGDSGGGVWQDGQLLANVWSGGVEISRNWLDRLLGSSRETETSLIFAASLPAAAESLAAGAGAQPTQLTTVAGGGYAVQP